MLKHGMMGVANTLSPLVRDAWFVGRCTANRLADPTRHVHCCCHFFEGMSLSGGVAVLSFHPLDTRVGLVLLGRTPEGNVCPARYK